MPNVERVNIVQVLEAERDDARRWAVRLEGMLAAAQERARSDLEREHARWRAADARAVDAEQQRDEVVAALETLLDSIDGHLGDTRREGAETVFEAAEAVAWGIVGRYHRASGPT